MHTSVTDCETATFAGLSKKDVVNLKDASLLGPVCDLEIDVTTGAVRALILSGGGMFASLSAKNRVVIPWRDVARIGADAILVKYIPPDDCARCGK